MKRLMEFVEAIFSTYNSWIEIDLCQTKRIYFSKSSSDIHFNDNFDYNLHIDASINWQCLTHSMSRRRNCTISPPPSLPGWDSSPMRTICFASPSSPNSSGGYIIMWTVRRSLGNCLQTTLPPSMVWHSGEPALLRLAR